MYLDTSQILQLSAAFVGTSLILIAAYAVPLKVSVGLLLFMIPFQPIETRFGSANIVMIYVLFGALLLRRRLRYMPMLGALLLVLFFYAARISQLPTGMYFTHALYVFFVTSGFVMFVLAYNMARETDNPRQIINWLIAANVLAIVYCFVQFAVGPGEKLTFFGTSELWMHRNRGGGDARLVGPFGTPGITSAYFMAMTIVVAYEILYSDRWRRIFLAALATGNIGMMVATGNRGSFLVLIASMLGFLYLFRQQLGILRAIRILVAAVAILGVAGTVVTTQTDFDNLFSRLQTVDEFENGLPDTRQKIWPRSWELVLEKPWLGHGPWLATESGVERSGRDVHVEQLVGSYPHNLYLYLLVTVGIVGTACWLFFLVAVTWRTYRGLGLGAYESDYEKGLVALGVLLAGAFFVDEMKIEFLRLSTIDYVQFILTLFGIFLGLSDRARARAAAQVVVRRADPGGDRVHHAEALHHA